MSETLIVKNGHSTLANQRLAKMLSTMFRAIGNGNVHMCYSPAGRSVLGKTVPEVLSTAQGHRPRAVLETEGTVFPNTD